LGAPNAAEIIEEAVSRVLDRGFRTSDILTDGTTLVSTSQMGSAVMDAIITA
jgi:3-isopropylmalate dehydrogenase